MNWKFLKTNWFYLTMGIILLTYALRKYPQLNPLSPIHQPNRTEKLTESTNSSKKGAALLGIVPDSDAPKRTEAVPLNTAQTEAFLKRFAPVVVSEHKKFGIPASVMLAVALVNSQSGTAKSVRESHNFFAIPCGENWDGETMVSGEYCLRKYESAWASFRDFSIYLSSQDWIGSLKKSAGGDWRPWAEKLGKTGISNTKAMKKAIETYQLEELDGV